MEIPRRPYYEKEITFRLSRSYGPGRYDPTYEEKGIDYPVGYVRWTERRNMEAFLALAAAGRTNVRGLITHQFRIDEAIQAYDLITGGSDELRLAMLLHYDAREPQPTEPGRGDPACERRVESPVRRTRAA